MGKGDLVPRIITRFGVKLLIEGAAPLSAWPVNLSETGACVRLNQMIDPGRTIQLEIRLGESAAPMTLAARTVWLRRDESHQAYYCGLGFVELDDEQLNCIREYVQLGGAMLLRFLSEFPLFEAFLPDDCQSLLKIVTLRELERKEILYEDGARDVDLQGLFIVQSGLLSIFKGPRPQPDRQLAVVSSGQIFGETTLVNDQPHSATIMAVNDSRLIQINKVGFLLLRKSEPQLALKIMDVVARTLAARLGRTTGKLFSPLRL